MYPVALSLGPVSIRSFGIFLALSFLACLFVVWKRSREEGLSEEKVIDIFFLSTFAFLIVGRLGYVISTWSVFSEDFGRILLLFRYPGISFAWGLVFGSLLALGLARLFSLSSFLILDILFLGILAATPFWFGGCFLEGCMQSSPYLPLLMTGVFTILFVLMRILLARVRRSPDLHELRARPGFVTLCYLIFLSLSLLISTYVLSGRLANLGLLVLIVAVAALVVRYFKFLRNIQWSNFPAAFSHKLRGIWKRGATVLRRGSQS